MIQELLLFEICICLSQEDTPRCAHGVRAPIDGKCRIVFSSSIPHSVRHTYYSTPITQLHETHSEALVVSPKTHEFAKAAFAGGSLGGLSGYAGHGGIAENGPHCLCRTLSRSYDFELEVAIPMVLQE